MKTVHVRLGEQSYDIHIGNNFLEDLNPYLKNISLGSKGALITDTVVGPQYAKKIQQSFQAIGHNLSKIQVPAGENSKSIETALKMWKELLLLGLDRSSFIVTCGGGVVGDLGGFVAATFLRGIPFIQIPTSLLAQVDSSVGGKVGINLPEGKNLIGSFYQPQAVLIDVCLLSTLPEREFKAGLAEVIKYGIIWDKAFFHYLEKNLEALLKREEEPLIYAVAKSCQIKALVVEMDEKEIGMRAVLNFGHTFGHAYEAASEYKDLRHGEAIAVGMVAAAKLSHRMQLCSKEVVDSIEALFKKAGLPTQLKQLSLDQVKKHMKVDKKAKEGKINFILAESIGKVIRCNDIPEEDLNVVLQESLTDA